MGGLRLWMRRPGVATAVVAGLVAWMTLLSAAPGRADADHPDETADPVPAGFASWEEVYAVQERLEAADERILSAPGADAGLAGRVAALDRRTLVVYWKGPMPSETSRLIDELRRGVPVEVWPARYSATELSIASKALLDYRGVASAGGDVDGSGITATVTADAIPGEWRVDVPVRVVSGELAEPVGCTGRQDDCWPYRGGARFVNASGGKCTTGFAVHDSAGWSKNLTAAHCSPSVGVIRDGGGETIGMAINQQQERDIMLITPWLDKKFDGRIYGGPWNAGLINNRPVENSATNPLGSYVCTSGASTGQNCNVKVIATNQWIKVDGRTIGPVIRADKMNPGWPAVGKGDSGGAVYYPTAAGKVKAKGTMSAAKTVVPCPAGSPSPMCFKTLFFADLTASLLALNVYLTKG